MPLQFFRRSKMQISRVNPTARDRISQLHLVYLKIAAYHCQDQPVARYISNRFNRLRRRYIQKSGKIFDTSRIRRQHLFQSSLFLTRLFRAHELSLLTIGCVIAGIALHRLILASLGNCNKLLRVLTTNRPTIGMNDNEDESASTKDGRIRLAHLVIAHIKPRRIRIETIQIFHNEFARPQHTPTWAWLITLLGLNLIDKLRQISITAHKFLHEQSHNLLMCRAKHHVALSTILKAKEDRTIALRSTRT